MKYRARLHVLDLARKVKNLTTSKDISGGDAPSHQCHVQITGKGGVRTCQHRGSHHEEDKYWCALHAPSNVAKKKARKAAKEAEKTAERAAKLAEKQAPLDGEETAAAEPALKLPETVEEAARLMLVLASEAQSALARMSNMTSRGWPENTPVENYRTILQTINDEAAASAESIRSRLGKARQVLQPVGYPQG
jgi:hypothetical protein